MCCLTEVAFKMGFNLLFMHAACLLRSYIQLCNSSGLRLIGRATADRGNGDEGACLIDTLLIVY